MKLAFYGIKKVRTRAECKRAGGVYRKGIRGVRKASCAVPSKRSPGARSRANMARKGMGRFVKRGMPCRPNEKKVLIRSRRNRRGTESCVRR